MEHSEKVEVTPKDTNFKKYTDKLYKLLKTILKLPKINGYDYTGRLKSKNGTYIEKSNLIQLLNRAMLSSRVLIGENDFIQLLYEANFQLDLIINDNVRVKLMQVYNKNQNEKKTTPKIIDKQGEIEKPPKRTHNDEDEYITVKRKKTEMPKLTPYICTPIDPRQTMPELHKYDDEEAQNINNRKRKRVWVFPDDDE